jgi:hypothetical protein
MECKEVEEGGSVKCEEVSTVRKCEEVLYAVFITIYAISFCLI